MGYQVTHRIIPTFLVLMVLGVVLWWWTWPEEVVVVDTTYLDATKPIDERIEILLRQMTLREKIGQMALVEKNSVKDVRDVARYGLGAVLSGSGGKPEDNTPQGWRTMTDAFHVAARSSRLKIPLLYGADANHGHGNVPGATIFPHQIGLGATHDVALVQKIGQATAQEMRATGVNWNYMPSLDLPKDIRWGRVYEAFGDDPVEVALLGSAFVAGSQSTSSHEVYVLTTPKHYVGNGSMVWGSSTNKNFTIDQGVTPPRESALRDAYLLPFRAVVDGGALSIMAGLNSWGDTKVSASGYLLTDILKGELGFAGFVVSDWYGVYEIAESEYDSLVIGINAGIDMVMLPFDYKEFVRHMERAVRAHDISEARIDDAVRRILRAKFSAGLFDDASSTVPDLSVVGSRAHRTLAREAVAKSLVLLKNKGGVLPISTGVERILVAGSGADNAGRQMGAWTVEWQGVDGNWVPGVTTILDGIRSAVANDTVVQYDPRGIFAEGVRAEVGIVVVSEKPYAEGWGDNALPTVSDEDREAIRAMQARVDGVVVVFLSGRPLIITDEVAQWDALIAAWLPGSEGAGVADVLFGAMPTTGTLPVPWPRTIEQVPVRVDGVSNDGTPFLYPRGYGL